MVVAGQPEPGEPSIFSAPASSFFAHFRLRLSGWPAEPFALRGVPEPTHLLAEKWRDAARRIASDADILARCGSAAIECPPGAQDLLDIIETARAHRGLARLGHANRAVNLAIRYVSDADRHGGTDAWSSPVATFASGEGDCEDYAIAKYVVLREAGIAPADLRLVVVRDLKQRDDHAVLAVRLESRWIVLDNRRLLLLEDADLPDYAALATLGPAEQPLQASEGGAEPAAPAANAASPS
jgi:predicted transglutaminase-like cysteine proteinase